MSRTVYALMVGIDSYPSPVPSLRGCVNDITAMEQFLRARIASQDIALNLLPLKNEQATRQAVIDGFLHHLTQAGPQDVALFYYSGHGSQERTPPEFWHLEPDRLDETLVCFDSRLPGNYDLADKELSKLIAGVAKNDTHVLIILDSCHSGSGTRAFDAEGIRRVPTDLRERPLNTFILTPDEAASQTSREPAAAGTQNAWVRLPKGKHIVLAACQDDEEARETSMGGQPRGVFSYFLTQSLERGDAQLTYRDVFKRTQALVRTSATRQSPLIEATESQELDRPFLGGAIKSHPPYFTASYHLSDGWTIDGGAVHGIAPVIGNQTTTLALFSYETSLSQLNSTENATGTAQLTERRPTRSRINISLRDGSQPDPQQTFRAVIQEVPLALAAPLNIEIVGNAEGIERARNAISTAVGNQPSMLVREVAEAGRLRLIARADGYRIMQVVDDRPLVIDINDATERGAKQAVRQLEHIARWQRIAELSNPATKLKSSDIQMEILLMPDSNLSPAGEPQVVDVAAQGSELRLEYRYEPASGDWKPAEFKVRLKNNSGRELYFALLDLTESYGVSTDLMPGGTERLKPGEETYAFSKEPIPASVPDDWWHAGLAETTDLLKLIVSTANFDATLFYMDELNVQVEQDAKALGSRKLGGGSGVNLDDWMTTEVSITIVRPLPGAALPGAGKELTLAPQVTLSGHEDFQAQVRLTTIPLASRAARLDASDLPRFPRLLTDDPGLVKPLQLIASRGSETGASVLELTHVDAAAVATVTPEKPLVLKVDKSFVADNESVLPVGYDNEFYLPLGRARRAGEEIEIVIERLPEPVVDSRSLTGSIRIFFHKVVSETFGLEFAYPLLAIAESDAEGGVRYVKEPARVRAGVAAANRILLYIHGIIGDTKGMAGSSYSAEIMASPPLEFLSNRYEVVLTFDYENLNTPIEKNARLLKERLVQAGLGAGHGKTLHIVAHSMGGLVSRWFIEREGGNQIVQHLVMLGTPNGGSPWSTIEDLAVIALGLGLNGLTGLVWPVKNLSPLVKAIESIDVTLDQMNAQSQFLETLEASPYPGVPYSIIAGNTSLIAPPETGKEGRLARLLSRLKPGHLLHKTTALAFFGNPNDIAASVKSIKNIPQGWPQQPAVREVACDHITYFSTEAGLRVLAEILD
jgi:pimeloyl-ACP methyl ester carboxylesterase